MTIEWLEGKSWINQEGAQITIGLTDHAIAALGDPQKVNYVSGEGENVAPQDVLVVVEGSLGSIEVPSPISGAVAEWNASVSDDPEFLVDDPFGQGWLIRLEANDEEKLKEDLQEI